MPTNSNFFNTELSKKAVIKRLKAKEGSASSSNIQNPVSLDNLGDDWKTVVKDTKLQGASSHGAYFDSRGYLTTGYGSLVSKNKPGTAQFKQDIVNWISAHMPDSSINQNTNISTLYQKINNIDETKATNILKNIDMPPKIQGVKNLLSQRISSEQFNNLTPGRKAALVDMGFNLGIGEYDEEQGKGISGLHEFNKMLSALSQGNFQKAGDEIMDSPYASQVGPRAVENKNMMVSGNILQQYLDQDTSPSASTNTNAKGYNISKQQIEKIRKQYKDKPYSQFLDAINKFRTME